MCNRYIPPTRADIGTWWMVDAEHAPAWAPELFPRAKGPFIRSRSGGRELVVAQWGLIPHFAREARTKYSTNNARAEEVASKPSFREPWKKAQRCIIPAASFDEPNWESGRNVWWRFRTPDGVPWGLAGLWNAWLDRSTGELIESYTMLTQNADHHPLMRRMHKPDPALPAHAQDKRSVIPIAFEDVDAWLEGDFASAQALLRLSPTQDFDAGPITP